MVPSPCPQQMSSGPKLFVLTTVFTYYIPLPLFFCLFLQGYQDFPGNLDGKESTCNAGDPGLIPGWGRSPGEGNDNPLQYSCLGNPLDRGAWWSTIQGSQTVRHRHNLVTKQQQQTVIIPRQTVIKCSRCPIPIVLSVAPVWTQLLLPASLPGGTVITICEETEATPCEQQEVRLRSQAFSPLLCCPLHGLCVTEQPAAG